MSVISKSMTNLGPQVILNKLSIEKKAWFMFKFLCDELNGPTFLQVRSYLGNCRGTKTKVRLNKSGWRVGSKMTLNPKVPYECYPMDIIDRIVQDVHFVNILFVVMIMSSEVGKKYEVLVYKFVKQSSAFRFQEVFRQLDGFMGGSMSRTELSFGNLTLVPASNYPMGPLAVDRWGGPQGPRSEASYGRRANNYIQHQNIRLYKSKNTLDDPSDLGSFDSSDNATTTYREVAVSANMTDMSGDRFEDGEGHFNGEVTAIVNSHRQNFVESSITSDDSSRLATSSVDDSEFYGGPEMAFARVHGSRANGGMDFIDGTTSVRKVFTKKSRSGSSTKGTDDARGSNFGSLIDADLRYRAGVAPSMGSKSRSIDHLEHQSARSASSRPLRYRKIQQPPSRGTSRLDFHDDASVVSQGSVYLLNPKLQKTYVRKSNAPEDVYRNKYIGQF